MQRISPPADLYALAAETAAARGEARNRALPSGAYTEATRVARLIATIYAADALIAASQGTLPSP